MVSTRSAGKNPCKRRRVDDGPSRHSGKLKSENGESQDSEGLGEMSQTGVQGHLSSVQTCVMQLFAQVKSLQEQNRKFKDDLEQLHLREDASIQPKPSKRGGKSNTDLRNQVDSLRATIKSLKKERDKDRRKIRRLQEKEVKREANELADNGVADGDEDIIHRMRKLSRRFQDLMLAAVLEEHEECRICLEEMTLEKCSSFPCQHLICNDCLPGLMKASATDRDAEEVQCPFCRVRWPRDDCELVHMTPNDRWDELLAVAKEASELDRLGELSSSEEENEEDFIDDHKSEASSVSSGPMDEPAGETQSLGTDNTPLGTPPAEASTAVASYRAASSPQKKERLLRLAEERARKNRSSF